MDTKAFRSLSYGMYIIASGDAQGRSGCLVNTFAQVTGNPPRATVAVNKENATADVIRRVESYTASVLGKSAPMPLIGRFGFRSSVDYDKFFETVYAVDSAGMPTVTDHAVACFEVRVTETIDVGSHWLFIGDVVDAHVLGSDDTPMTYAYYHQVKGGKTPPKASSYIAEDVRPAPGVDSAAEAATSSSSEAIATETVETEPRATGNKSEISYAVVSLETDEASDADNGSESAAQNDTAHDASEDAAAAPGTTDSASPTSGTTTWRCLLCGYTVTIDGDELPADFACPMCGAGREMFERVN